MRHFLMTTREVSEDKAVSLMSVGIDFGVTQVVDGNWSIHAILKKSLFAGGEISLLTQAPWRWRCGRSLPSSVVRLRAACQAQIASLARRAP